MRAKHEGVDDSAFDEFELLVVDSFVPYFAHLVEQVGVARIKEFKFLFDFLRVRPNQQLCKLSLLLNRVLLR